MTEIHKYYCYATVNVLPNGYIIKVAEDIAFAVEVDSFPDPYLTLKIHPGPMNPNNVSIKIDNVDKLIYDARNRNGDMSFLMVYKYGKTKDEVMELIQPQLIRLIEGKIEGYKTLMDNARVALNHVRVAFSDQFICPKRG